MRPAAIAVTLAALAGPGLAFQDAHDLGDAAKVAALYRSNCSKCHLPPDPAFPVDRAWITQIQDTA